MTLTNHALRLRAEEIVHKQAICENPHTPELSLEALQQANHNLRVHQIELEMQNDELRRIQAALNTAQARYFDFYDLAPVGYVTVSENERESGLILQANLTAASMLGVTRNAMTKQVISRYIFAEDQDSYYLMRQRMRVTGTAQSCELRLCTSDNRCVWVFLQAIATFTDDGAPVLRMVWTDITERLQLQKAQLSRAVEESLIASRQRLRELVASNEATLEEERKHIAREVHDELGQVMTALCMDMSLLKIRFGALDPALETQINGMKAMLDRAILGVRNVATHLRPTALDMGLVPAIDWLCQVSARLTGMVCRLDAPENLQLDEHRAVVIFRIVQESLTNIARHARASLVTITLAWRDQNLWLQVRDNGCGFDMNAANSKPTFGLLGMHERALALGGQLTITSEPGHATVLELTIPREAACAGAPS